MTHGVQRGAHEALADLTLPPGDTRPSAEPLAARRVRVDPRAATKLDAGAAQSSAPPPGPGWATGGLGNSEVILIRAWLRKRCASPNDLMRVMHSHPNPGSTSGLTVTTRLLNRHRYNLFVY
jgi:hypothetical protein